MIFWKNSINFWHRKLTLKVQFRHFLTTGAPRILKIQRFPLSMLILGQIVGMETFRGQWHLVDTSFQNGRLLVDIFKGWNICQTSYRFWDHFSPHSWCIADSYIPFESLLSCCTEIWMVCAGRLIICKTFSNAPGLYRQDYYNSAQCSSKLRIRYSGYPCKVQFRWYRLSLNLIQFNLIWFRFFQ